MKLFPDRSRPLIFAHRGLSSLAPENTFAAFRKARELNVAGIELDVHICAENKLIVAHDDTFARTAGDNRAIKNLFLREIREIDVGAWFDPAFNGEKPPILEDVIEEFCPEMYIDIELKTKMVKDDMLPQLVAEKIIAFGDKIMNSISISSFNPFALVAFKRLCPKIPVALIWSADKEVPFILRYGFGRFIVSCDYLKPIYKQVNKGLFALKKPIVPWVIDDLVLAEKMLGAGCEGIISNKAHIFQ